MPTTSTAIQEQEQYIYKYIWKYSVIICHYIDSVETKAALDLYEKMII